MRGSPESLVEQVWRMLGDFRFQPPPTLSTSVTMRS